MYEVNYSRTSIIRHCASSDFSSPAYFDGRGVGIQVMTEKKKKKKRVTGGLSVQQTHNQQQCCDECLCIFVEWSEENGVSASDILVLKRLQKEVLKVSFQAKKQNKIERFYSNGINLQHSKVRLCLILVWYSTDKNQLLHA
ncbi:hypothetical protein J6590_026423 [Homalodisca vitripennis]|nr:hypothetical protein J6590_026423 [Homalodisca vitripennis]